VVLALITVATLATSPALAQNNPLATAEAARQRANSARATEQAAYGMATSQAVEATQVAQATATAASLQATGQAQATDQAVAATRVALEVQGTRQALDAQATREAMAATATVGAHQAQATIQAQEAQLAQLKIEQTQERGTFWNDVYQWVLMFGLAVGFVIVWRVLRWARQGEAVPVAMVGDLEAEVIDGEVVRRNVGQPVALIPERTGWLPAYLRPIEKQSQ